MAAFHGIKRGLPVLSCAAMECVGLRPIHQGRPEAQYASTPVGTPVRSMLKKRGSRRAVNTFNARKRPRRVEESIWELRFLKLQKNLGKDKNETMGN